MSNKGHYGSLFAFACFVAVLAHQQSGHEAYSHVTWFLAGWFALLLAAALLGARSTGEIKLHPALVFVCFLPFVGSEPLFENDQYRYLWEGKVLSAGHNPWTEAPASERLDGIDFPQRELVGFNKLTSPYSPLAVFYHALFSGLAYPEALVLLQLVNAVLGAWVVFLLPPLRPVYVVGLAGLIGKEFVQSVHIDLLVWIFLLFAMRFQEKASLLKAGLCFCLSALLKVNILLTAPWFVAVAYRRARFKGVLLWTGVLGVSIGANVLGPLNGQQASGLTAFLQHWVWHSALLDLWQYTGEEITSGIRLANIFWGLGLCVLGVLALIHRCSGLRWSTALFTLTAFCRPAFNAWYSPWFALNGAMAGEKWPLIYGLLSPLAYVKYADPAQMVLSLIIVTTHAPAVIYFYNESKKWIIQNNRC
jgi:hypothetical protein